MSINILVLGQASHGKDTFCKIAEEELGLSSMGSSWYCCEKFIFEQMKPMCGYVTPKECYEDRGNHRPFWYDSIELYNFPTWTRLGEEIFEKHHIYNGMRSFKEFNACCRIKLFDCIFWIDATERLGDTETSDSLTIPMSVADEVITNNGTEDEFRLKVVERLKAVIEELNQ